VIIGVGALFVSLTVAGVRDRAWDELDAQTMDPAEFAAITPGMSRVEVERLGADRTDDPGLMRKIRRPVPPRPADSRCSVHEAVGFEKAAPILRVCFVDDRVVEARPLPRKD
jgi:hypothetical protein